MAMDQQVSMDYLRDLYREKNEHLEKFLEPVTPFEFYREIFPVGSFERKGHFEDEKGNGIAVTVPKTAGIALGIEGDGKARRYTITDELSELSEVFDTDFTIMSPLSYFGRRRCGKNARYLYAMVFDLDGVGMPQLRDTLHQMNKDILPKATFVVNSGTGLHLYYVLQEPIPMYPHNQKCLKELKYSLTRQIWNRYTSTIKEPQVQGILQGFRVVGSGSKLGREYPVAAYRLGGRVTIEELLEFIPDSNGEQQQILGLMRKGRLSLVEAKEKYPDWYERRIVKKERRGRWTVKRDLYDWWLHRIEDEIRVGHRFYGIMTLAIYAKKCGISEDELRQDAFTLLKPYPQVSRLCWRQSDAGQSSFCSVAANTCVGIERKETNDPIPYRARGPRNRGIRAYRPFRGGALRDDGRSEQHHRNAAVHQAAGPRGRGAYVPSHRKPVQRHARGRGNRIVHAAGCA